MTRGTTLGGWGLLLLLQAAPAAAQKSWSVQSGSTIGANHVAVQVQAGWPELALGGTYGYSDRLDLGVRFAFTYGQDGSVGFGVGPAPGFRMQASARYELVNAGAIRLSAAFAPGFGLDYLPGVGTPRILLPIQLALGIVPSDALVAHVGLDLPLYVTLGTVATSGGLSFPILVGGGVEYRLDRALSATGLLRVGPVLEVSRPGAPSHLAVQALVGLAFRL